MTQDYGDYAALMQGTWDDLPRPKILPIGTWRLVGRNAAFLPKTETLNARFLFFYQAKEAFDDVSESELEALGPDYDLSMNDIVHTVWMESEGDFAKKVQTHLEKHGNWNPGNSPQEGVANFRGAEIVAFLGKKNIVNKQTGEVREDNVPSNFVTPKD